MRYILVEETLHKSQIFGFRLRIHKSSLQWKAGAL